MEGPDLAREGDDNYTKNDHDHPENQVRDRPHAVHGCEIKAVPARRMPRLMELIPSPLATAAAWILTVTFGWAVVAKFVRGNSWPSAVTRFGFRGAVAQVIVFAVPMAEAAVVVAFVGGLSRVGGSLTLTLVAAFSAAIVRARMHQGNRLPCGCFGKTHERDYRLLLARNSLLALLAVTVLLGPSSASLEVPEGAEVVPLVLVVVGSLLIAWMGIQTVTSLRRR